MSNGPEFLYSRAARALVGTRGETAFRKMRSIRIYAAQRRGIIGNRAPEIVG